jgi:hypothetical protein
MRELRARSQTCVSRTGARHLKPDGRASIFGRCFMFQMFHSARVSARCGWGDKISPNSGADCREVECNPAARQALKRRPGGRALLAADALLLAACGRATPALEYTEAAALLSHTKAGVIDGLSRVREIYCAVRPDHGAGLPYDRPCEDSAALWRLHNEPPPTVCRARSAGICATHHSADCNDRDGRSSRAAEVDRLLRLAVRMAICAALRGLLTQPAEAQMARTRTDPATA